MDNNNGEVKAFINNNGGEFLLGFTAGATVDDIAKAINKAVDLATATIDMVTGDVAYGIDD